MQIKASRWAEERRAYYRLLRHLLSEEVHSAYPEERSEPLPDRLRDLMASLDRRAPPERH